MSGKRNNARQMNPVIKGRLEMGLQESGGSFSTFTPSLHPDGWDIGLWIKDTEMDGSPSMSLQGLGVTSPASSHSQTPLRQGENLHFIS